MQNWIKSISPSSGIAGTHTVSVTVNAHTGRVNRTKTLTASVSSTAPGLGSNTATINVTQKGAPAFSITKVVKKSSPSTPISKDADGYNIANIEAVGDQIIITGTSNLKDLEVTSATGFVDLKKVLVANGSTVTGWDGQVNVAIPDDPGASNAYSFTLTVTLPNNKSTVAKTFKFTLGAEINSTSFTVTQKAGAKVWGIPTITSLTYPTTILPAGGGNTGYPTVVYSQVYTWNGVSGSGETNNVTVKTDSIPSGTTFAFSNNITAPMISMDHNAGTGVVTVASAGTDVSSNNLLGGKMTATITVNGRTSAKSENVDIYRKANTRTVGDIVWLLVPKVMSTTVGTYTEKKVPASGDTAFSYDSYVEWYNNTSPVGEEFAKCKQTISFESGSTGTITDKKVTDLNPDSYSKIVVTHSDDPTGGIPGLETTVTPEKVCHTFTITATGFDSKISTKSVAIKQVANSVSYTQIDDFTLSPIGTTTFPAEGSDLSKTVSATAKYYANYTSGSKVKKDPTVTFAEKAPVTGFSFNSINKTVTVAVNNTESPRGPYTIVATFSPIDSDPVKSVTKEFIFNQEANSQKLRVSPLSLTFEANTDLTKTITITASGDWTIS